VRNHETTHRNISLKAVWWSEKAICRQSLKPLFWWFGHRCWRYGWRRHWFGAGY